jgi:hypothetical protein
MFITKEGEWVKAKERYTMCGLSKQRGVQMFVGALMFCLILGQGKAKAGALEGRVGLGGLIVNSGNNLNPRDSSKRLDDLSSSAKKETSVIPVILPEFTYDVGEEEALKLYFTASPPIDEVGGFALNVGATYSLPQMGILDGSVFFTPFNKAWENPYETGVNRKETDTSKYGAKIGWNKVMNSNFGINLVYMNDDVDDDIIGQLQPDLERDGAVYAVNMNYSFYPSDGLEIRPRISFLRGEYEGDANSFNKYKVELEARYRTGKIMVVPKVYYSHSDFDELNPVFNEERENDSYGLSLLANYMAPFNCKKWSTTALLSASKGDSNITFYDTEAITFGGFVNYHF